MTTVIVTTTSTSVTASEQAVTAVQEVPAIVQVGPAGPTGATGPAGPAGAGGVTDGDKGDITVTSSGAVWTIDNGVVTVAKLSFDPATQAELDSEASARANADLLLQPLDSDLTAIAALTTTSFGRALLALADAAALRTAGGLGTAAVADTGTGGANVPTITQADARYQALDSDLTAIAALTTTAYGRSLLAAADAAALQVLGGLVIGTNVQAYDAELAALAGLTSAADKGIQFTGAGTAATFDLTTAGKALLDDAAASNQRTTLGLGTIATQDANNVSISGGAVTGITDLALADGGTGASLTDPNADRILFWDDSAGSTAFLTAGTNLTITGTTIDAAGGSGAPTGAKYVTGASDAGLSAELIIPAFVDHPDIVPASPHADDEEFDSALSGSWAWTNQGTAAQTIAGSHLIIANTPAVSTTVIAMTKTFTAGNYIFTAKIRSTIKLINTYAELGFVLTDGTKFTNYAWALFNGSPAYAVMDWTNSTSFSATAFNGLAEDGPCDYFRLQDDGTNILFSVSKTGLPGTFVLLYSRTRTSFLTATKIGFGGRVGSGAPYSIAVDFLRRT